jgi:SPP1 family phage portal protein
MQEDSRSTILVIKNYDGQDLGEFRQKLAMYGAVKVRTIDGADGGVDTLQVEINPENYELILKTLKTAIIENAMSYDAKDDKLGQNANQMNLLCVYNDISLDADNTEAEYQESFEKLLKFIKWHLKNTGKGDFIDVPVTITFNRDMIQNESDIIRDMVSLGVQLPNRLLVSQIPFVHNVQNVMDELEKERKEMDIYGQSFGYNSVKGEPNEGK